MTDHEPRPAGDYFRSFNSAPNHSQEETTEADTPAHPDGIAVEAEAVPMVRDSPDSSNESYGWERQTDPVVKAPLIQADEYDNQASWETLQDQNESTSQYEQESVNDPAHQPDLVEPLVEQTAGRMEAPIESDVSSPKALERRLDVVDQKLADLLTRMETVSTEVRETRKLYHQEFAGRLQNLQKDVDRSREIENGRIFDGILGSLARLYHEYESNTGVIEDDKSRRLFGYMLDDIANILETNNVQIQKSKAGDKRNPRHSQIAEKLLTEDPELHDTVARSKGTGFHIESRTLLREIVDIYVYSGTDAETPAQN